MLQSLLTAWSNLHLWVNLPKPIKMHKHINISSEVWSDNSILSKALEKIFSKRWTTLTRIRVAIRCCSFPHIEAARDCATQDLGAWEGATGRQLVPTRDHAYFGA